MLRLYSFQKCHLQYNVKINTPLSDKYKTQSIVETDEKSIYLAHIYTLLPNIVAWYRHFNKKWRVNLV